MNCSTPGLPVHHQLPEFTQTHVSRVGDAIPPSHPLSSPSPPAPNPSQHQGLFRWVNSSHEMAKVLEFQLQHQFFQWIPRSDLLFFGLGHVKPYLAYCTQIKCKLEMITFEIFRQSLILKYYRVFELDNEPPLRGNSERKESLLYILWSMEGA